MVLVWISNYVARTVASSAIPFIRNEFGVSYEIVGLGVFTILFLGYFSMQLPAGYLGDRVRRKRILVIGPLGWGLFTILAGLSKTFEQISACRLLTGLFQGTQFGNDRAVIASVTPKEKMGLGQGVSFSGLGIGMGLGLLLGGYLINEIGWRQTFILLSTPSFIGAFLIALFLRENAHSQQFTIKGVGRVGLRAIFRSRDHWLLNIAAFSTLFSLWSILWIPNILIETGFDITLSSLVTSFFGFASVPALIFTGWISDKLVKSGLGRKIWLGCIIVLFGITTSLLAYSIFIKANVLLITLLIFSAGFWQWGVWSVLYSIIAEITPKSIHGTAYGLNNFIGQIGGFSPWIIGWIRDFTGSFIPALFLCSLITSIGGLSAWCIRPAFKAKPEIPLIGDST
jgi:MFS family permease